MISHVTISNHGLMAKFIKNFLFRKSINVPFIKFISRHRELVLKAFFFKLHIQRCRPGIPIFCESSWVWFFIGYSLSLPKASSIFSISSSEVVAEFEEHVSTFTSSFLFITFIVEGSPFTLFNSFNIWSIFSLVFV